MAKSATTRMRSDFLSVHNKLSEVVHELEAIREELGRNTKTAGRRISVAITDAEAALLWADHAYVGYIDDLQIDEPEEEDPSDG